MVFDVREVAEDEGALRDHLLDGDRAAARAAARSDRHQDRSRDPRASGGGGTRLQGAGRRDRSAQCASSPPRGMGMAVVSLIMVGMGPLAEVGPVRGARRGGPRIMYIASTAATITSAFAVRAFDDRVRRGPRRDRPRDVPHRRRCGRCGRGALRARARAGAGRLPLHIEEALPLRLGGDTRFALDRSVSRAEVTVSAPLPRTPRGLYRVGPAEIWYEDVLGLTRVFVASRATASLRALPRLRNVVFDKRGPRSLTKADGPLEHALAAPHRGALPHAASTCRATTSAACTGSNRSTPDSSRCACRSRYRSRLPGCASCSTATCPPGGASRPPPAGTSSATANGPSLRARRGARRRARSPRRGLGRPRADAPQARRGRLARHRRARRRPASSCARSNASAARSGSGAPSAPTSCWQHHPLAVEHLFAAVSCAPAVTRQAGEQRDRLGRALARAERGPRRARATSSPTARRWSRTFRPTTGASSNVSSSSTIHVGAEDNRINWRRLFSPRPPEPEIIRRELTRAANAAVEHARGSRDPGPRHPPPRTQPLPRGPV